MHLDFHSDSSSVATPFKGHNFVLSVCRPPGNHIRTSLAKHPMCTSLTDVA